MKSAFDSRLSGWPAAVHPVAVRASARLRADRGKGRTGHEIDFNRHSCKHTRSLEALEAIDAALKQQEQILRRLREAAG